MGSDPGGAPGFDFAAVRLHSAPLCDCDPLAEGPFAGADALRPVSPMPIAALCAPSRTGATRAGSGGGCAPLAEGPFAGADALRPVSPMPIAALCAPSRPGATRTGSGAHPRSAGSLLRASPNPAPSYAGAPRFGLRLVWGDNATVVRLNALLTIQHMRRE